jgi:hypothetical protein
MRLTRRTSEPLRTHHDALEPNPIERLLLISEQMQKLSDEVKATAESVREEMKSGASHRTKK